MFFSDEKNNTSTETIKDLQVVRNDHKRKHSDSEVPDANKLLVKAENGVETVDNTKEISLGKIVEASINQTIKTPVEMFVKGSFENSLENEDILKGAVTKSDQHKPPSISEKSLKEPPSLGLKNPGSELSNSKLSDDLAIEYLVPNDDDRFITDIKEYRKTLELYPVMKLK